MSGVRWAVSLRASNSVADDTFVPTDRVRKAATQPAATGQAAETPVSGTKTRLTLEPRKCVYPTRSGFCWSFGFVYMLAMDRAARGISNPTIICVAAADRKHVPIGIGTHDHATGRAQAGSRGATARAIAAVAAIVAAENDIHSGDRENLGQPVENVRAVVDEPELVTGRVVLQARVKNPPAVADDKCIKRRWRSKQPYLGQVQIRQHCGGYGCGDAMVANRPCD